MANINHIRISGVTYSIEDIGAQQSLSAKQDTLVSGTNIKTINNQSLLGSGNIAIQGGSGATVTEVTQAEYDALVTAGTVDLSTLYIITDATAVDISQYYTSAQTESAITQAVSGKQDTLVSGTNIKSINNESILGEGNITIEGGGGGTYSAGTNIDITNDTISCTLPISATDNSFTVGTQTSSGATDYVIGNYNNFNLGQMASVNHSHIIGSDNKFNVGVFGSVSSCYIFGKYNTIDNESNIYIFGEQNKPISNTFTIGKYSKYANENTDSGRTYFAVGNGTSSANTHNAFEIRQNGDIYISSGGTDIKLQDNLGGGVASSAVTSGDTNAVSSDAVYEQLGGLKLQQITQADYDALVSGGTVDNSTLYVIVN